MNIFRRIHKSIFKQKNSKDTSKTNDFVEVSPYITYSSHNINIDFKRLRDTSITIPTRGSDYAAGYDLYACGEEDSYAINPHTVQKIPTGLAMSIPNGYFGAIFARSGIATKQGLRPANCVGVIDSDYRGEIIVALRNDTTEIQEIKNGERIAQIVFIPCCSVEFNQVVELDETVRGSGGFGSTGTN